MSDTPIQYRKLRAPQQHNTTLIDPPLSESSQLLETNLQLIYRSDSVQVCGEPLSALRVAARKSLLRKAIEHTTSYSNQPTNIHENRIFLSGHQPKLFHPGVWFKNVLLHQLAEKLDATPINVIIDNDLCGELSIMVPSGTLQSPEVTKVPYDDSNDNLPFEEVTVSNQQLFDSFAARVAKTLIHCDTRPDIDQFWKFATESETNNLGLKLAQARHQLELQHGINNLEIPLSTICQTPEFLKFCTHLMMQADEFRSIYNTSLQEYRNVHKIRSSSHPVPALEEINGAVEVPFWIWTDTEPERKPLYCLAAEGQLTLQSASGHMYGTLGFSEGQESALEQLTALVKSGVKIRPRALTTTMYCRLMLSDLFIHGIGGGKYDQLTDQIATQFFQAPLPDFLVATATAQLFGDQLENPTDKLHALETDLRNLEFSPDKFARKLVNQEDRRATELEKLINQKLQHVQKEVTPEDRPVWHLELQHIHHEIKSLLQDDLTSLLAMKESLQNQLRAYELLNSREYSLVLFNVKTLLDSLVTAAITP